MSIRSLIFIICLFLGSILSHAGIVDTIDVWSPAMQRNVKTVVISPETPGRYPVIYLLHGYGGNHQVWLNTTKPELPAIADKENVIFVCPDGRNSWYFDSPKDKASSYLTFVTKELIRYIDNHYSTVASREGRAITGFSMGGHGALWCALNSKMYCAAGSMSGGVDIVPYPNGWEIKKVLGVQKENPEIWKNSSVINNVAKLKGIELIVDCGIDDFFYKDNLRFHKKLVGNGIPHDFISRPGKHTHKYWGNSLDYQILFFKKCFGCR